MTHKGHLITLEGPDGAGKSSVLEKIVPQLESEGLSVITTREPGGVTIAEAIRSVILDPTNVAMDDKTELLLYVAARRQHWVEKVLPSLSGDKVVIIDRFIDSSIAYQGYGRGLSIGDIAWLNRYATDGYVPDLTLYLDIETREGLARINRYRSSDIDRLDMASIAFHERVRQGYLALAKQESRIVTVDASQGLDSVANDVYMQIRNKVIYDE